MRKLLFLFLLIYSTYLPAQLSLGDGFKTTSSIGAIYETSSENKRLMDFREVKSFSPNGIYSGLYCSIAPGSIIQVLWIGKNLVSVFVVNKDESYLDPGCLTSAVVWVPTVDFEKMKNLNWPKPTTLPIKNKTNVHNKQ